MKGISLQLTEFPQSQKPIPVENGEKRKLDSTYAVQLLSRYKNKRLKQRTHFILQEENESLCIIFKVRCPSSDASN